MRRSGRRKEPARTARGRLFACVFVMTQNASSPACVLRRRTNKQAAVCGAHERAVQHAKEMSARESDDPIAASAAEECSVTVRPAAIRAARRRAICQPFTECVQGIAAASTNVELEGEKLFGSIFRLVRSFSIALVDDVVAWRQALGAIGRPIVGCVGSRRHAAKRWAGRTQASP